MQENVIEGGCQCGAVRYELSSRPLTLYCCHCTECQQQSASAFGMSLRVNNSDISFTGQTDCYVRDKGKPTEVQCLFCPECGTRLAHRRNERAASASIKFSSLDDRTKFQPIGHIWTTSKQDWVILDETHLIYDKQPDDQYAALIEAFQARYFST